MRLTTDLRHSLKNRQSLKVFPSTYFWGHTFENESAFEILRFVHHNNSRAKTVLQHKLVAQFKELNFSSSDQINIDVITADARDVQHSHFPYW